MYHKTRCPRCSLSTCRESRGAGQNACAREAGWFQEVVSHSEDERARRVSPHKGGRFDLFILEF